MIHYSTKRAYQRIHWINGSIKRPTEVLMEICSLLNITIKQGKNNSVPKKFRLKKPSQFSNCALFISGFPKLSREQKLIETLGRELYENGHVCFVLRDTTDNPEFFNEIKAFGGLVFVPDYTVVSVKTTDKDTKNVLCIGGDITIDRSWKIKQNGIKKLLNRNIYYPNERPIYNDEAMNEIIKCDDLNIDMIVSVIPISYVGNDPYSDNAKWFEEDPELKKDVISSREVMDKVLLTLRKENKEPCIWCHCQYDGDSQSTVMGVRFISNDSYRDYDNLIICFNSWGKKKNKTVMRNNSYIQNMIDEEKAMSERDGRRLGGGLRFNPMHFNPVLGDNNNEPGGYYAELLDEVDEGEEEAPALPTDPWSTDAIDDTIAPEPQNIANPQFVQMPENIYRINYEDIVNRLNYYDTVATAAPHTITNVDVPGTYTATTVATNHI